MASKTDKDMMEAIEKGRKLRAQREAVRNMKYGAVLGLTIAALAFVGVGNRIEQDKEKEAQKKEQMAQDKRVAEFAQYVLDDISNAVDEKVSKQAIREMAAEYKRNPEFYNKRIERLAADSARYADAIVRDAAFIKDNKTISFAQAMEIVESQEALVYGPKYKTNVQVHEGAGLHGEDVTEYVREQTGELEVKGANNGPERKMKINKKHLTNVMTELAAMRAAKAND